MLLFAKSRLFRRPLVLDLLGLLHNLVNGDETQMACSNVYNWKA